MQQVAAQHLPAGKATTGQRCRIRSYNRRGRNRRLSSSRWSSRYLFLAALYESWTLPLSVILPVAFALFGGLLALVLRGMALDVYGQIGLVLLIGLAAKNAILIVEFAKDRLERGGVDVRAAAEEGARTRYRAVMMTALAFIIGVIPLVLATGAGAGARQSIGTTVFGGMILASFIGVLFVPPLFVLFEIIGGATSRFIRRRGSPVHPAE